MIGRTISHYRILGRLGSGGMGEVYLALDTDLGREVALKVVPEEMSRDPQRLERFRQEARTLASLNHPNIVTIYSVEETEGLHFLTMERVEGKSLDRLIPENGLDLEGLLEIAVPLTEALSAAHDKGVAHRDLKPANVMFSNEGRVKILDFGLAKQVQIGPDSATIAGLTAEGTIVGTMPYMSPEQVEGKPVDHRTDVFSLGVVLHEMATGSRPFLGDTSASLISSILKDVPRPVTEIRTDLPPALGRLVERCLQKEPGERIQTANEVREELAGLREETPHPSGVSATRPAGPVGGSRIVRWAGGVLIGLLLLVAMFWLGRGLDRGGGSGATGLAEISIAVLPFENLGSPEDAYFADGMTDEVRSKLSSLGGLRVIARGSAEQYRKTEKTPDQIAAELDVRYILSATVRWVKAEQGASRIRVTPELVEVERGKAPTTKWQRSFDAILSDVFRVQGDIATQVAQALDVALGTGERDSLAARPTADLEAYDAFLRGEETSANLGTDNPAMLLRAAEHYEEAVRLDPGFGLAWAQLSRARSLAFFTGVPSPQQGELAREAAEQAQATGSARVESRLAMGDYWLYVGRDHARALAEYSIGLETAPGSAELLSAAAAIEERLGRWEDALTHLERARELDPRSVMAVRLLGSALLWTRDYEEARRVQDWGLSLAPMSLELIEDRVMLELAEGNLDGARATIADALTEIDPSTLVAYLGYYWDLYWVLEDDEISLLLSLTPEDFNNSRSAWGLVLAQTHALKGDRDQSRRYAEQARLAYEALLEESPDDAQSRMLHGVALAHLGRREEALREGRRAVELTPFSEDAYVGAYLQHQLARIHLILGEPEHALDLLAPLLEVPYVLSPGWLRVDPNFAALRGNPRFEQLVRAGSLPRGNSRAMFAPCVRRSTSSCPGCSGRFSAGFC